MTRHIAHAVIAAVVFAAPLGAQSPQPGQGPQPAQPAATQPADSQSEQKTAIGCVAAGADGRTFTFTEAAGAAASAATPAPASWTLMPRSDLDLTKYVGKKVEVTGKPDAKGGASAYPDSGASRSPSATTGPRFHVKSVRVLAETCQ